MYVWGGLLQADWGLGVLRGLGCVVTRLHTSVVSSPPQISLLEESLAEAEGDFDRVEAVAERRAGAALGAARALGGELLAASLARVEARSVEVQVRGGGHMHDDGKKGGKSVRGEG